MIVIKLLGKLFRRRRDKQPEAASRSPKPAEMPSAPTRTVRGGATLIIWESELRAIAAETSAWTIETGGDLFGRWQGNPTVFLATKAGPKAQRSNAHFRLDVDYLRQLSEPLASYWALRYFGDWHSHHRLGLSAPSSGDRRRIRQLGNRNQFPAMAEIIVTTEGSRREPVIRVNPWFYDLSREDEPSAMSVNVLHGCSPIREALIARRDFPEQSLRAWEEVPLDRIRISDALRPPAREKQPTVDATTRDKTLNYLVSALKDASDAPVEQHATAFGQVLVVKLREPHHLAFAIDGKWPMSVLEVHRLDRESGTTEAISARKGLVAADVAGLVEVFRVAKAAERM
jgi:hypothetical protein